MLLKPNSPVFKAPGDAIPNAMWDFKDWKMHRAVVSASGVVSSPYEKQEAQ